MPLDTAPLWEVLQWSGCVLVAVSLLPVLLILCTRCAKRKPTPPPAGLELEQQTEQPPGPVAADLQNKSKSPESENPIQVQQTRKVSQRPGDVGMRQLPRIPQQGRQEFRRHSSYTGSNVYDVVSELRSHWPELDSRKTSAGSHLYEEPFPVYAQVCKTKTPSHSRRDADLHLYAQVKKTGGRSVKSEIIL